MALKCDLTKGDDEQQRRPRRRRRRSATSAEKCSRQTASGDRRGCAADDRAARTAVDRGSMQAAIRASGRSDPAAQRRLVIERRHAGAAKKTECPTARRRASGCRQLKIVCAREWRRRSDSSSASMATVMAPPSPARRAAGTRRRRPPRSRTPSSIDGIFSVSRPVANVRSENATHSTAACSCAE